MMRPAIMDKTSSNEIHCFYKLGPQAGGGDRLLVERGGGGGYERTEDEPAAVRVSWKGGVVRMLTTAAASASAMGRRGRIAAN
jgi:hypothetical protein